ncbi:MAG TPA: SRPBCC family protein [Thermoanaerobaculia bacterium]|nr:SRPBCC family protein [Thermoanaerobaculia bacterium]
MPFLSSRRALGAVLAALWLAGLSPEESRRLDAGEVLVELRTVRAGAPKEGIGRGVIAAPPERVFRALTDYQYFDEFMPFVESSDAAPQPDGTVISFQRLDLPAPIGDRFYKIRARAAVEGKGKSRVWRTRWSYVPGSGNVADHHGSWSLVELSPGRTLATCQLYTDPGGNVPDWAMDRATRKSLPWIFDGLRQQVRRGRYN